MSSSVCKSVRIVLYLASVCLAQSLGFVVVAQQLQTVVMNVFLDIIQIHMAVKNVTNSARDATQEVFFVISAYRDIILHQMSTYALNVLKILCTKPAPQLMKPIKLLLDAW